MFESIKNKIWELLEEKEISLVMLYDRKGEILWHKGREIKGKTVARGEGFSKSLIEKSLHLGQAVEEENVILSSQMDDLSRSAFVLQIKSVVILPVGDHFFLYLDSGARDSFSTLDREIFKVIGSFLGEMISQVRKNESDIGGISGTSESISRVRDLVLKYSLEEEPVLLLGETGVGKSRIAELIHLYSGRKGKFVIINTPTIPDNLFESEVFGHKKGAFTDAKADKKGFVHEARGGTLFLDEISEIPMAFQAKLLRFIETKKYQILGDPAEQTVDVRIIAATNRDLARAIDQEKFREDLYYRLQVLEILIPPLRERPEDIRQLVTANMALLQSKQIGPGFWQAIGQHRWPGNIRELITVMRRAGIHAQDPVTGADISGVINRDRDQSSIGESAKTERHQVFWTALEQGSTFWKCVWEPFISRELNKREVKQFLKEGYVRYEHSLKKLSIAMGITDGEFKRFISALHKYHIHPAK